MSSKLGIGFWIIGIAGLLWNLLGFGIYYAQMTATPESLANNYSPAQVQYLLNVPMWVNGAYGLAVTTGALGCIALLLRKAVAKILFILSLAGILLQNIYGFLIGDALQVFGTAAAGLPVVVIAIAAGLLYYSISLGKADVLE